LREPLVEQRADLALDRGFGRHAARRAARALSTSVRTAWHSGPPRTAASASRNTRVFAGIKRLPGKTAHALTGAGRHSGSTHKSSLRFTWASAKWSFTA